jgi:signal transduction histidine kinase
VTNIDRAACARRALRRGLNSLHGEATQPRYWLRLALVAGAYVGAAKLGIDLSVAHGVVTPVWAPTGIALAALLLFGVRMWPAVALGAFVANATSDVSALVAAGITIGNTLEAVVGAHLLRRADFRASLGRARDVFLLVIVAGLVSTTVSATNGVTTLWLAGLVSSASYGSEWMLWWFGDVMGDLLVAPLLLVWAAGLGRPRERRKMLEGIALLSLLATTSWAVFVGGNWHYPYLLFPFLIWATLRFKQVGAATSTFVVAAIAIWGIVQGSVTIGGATSTENVQILQALLAVVAISLLVLGATLVEREVAERALQQAHASLAGAQELARLGSWEWNIETGRLTWSHELYRIYGLTPHSVEVTHEGFLERVHPDDRTRVREAIAKACRDHEPCTLDHEIVLPDGSVRCLQGRAEVEADESGVAVRMVGIAQDMTEQRQIDRLRDGILATVSHELRTPLTSILGFSLTLEHRTPELADARVREMIAHISQQARKLDRLLSGLLDLDRLGRGLVYPTLRPTDVGRLVEQMAASQDTNGHTIDVRAESVIAEIDAPKVERIVDNLLANAVKYAPTGTQILIRVEGNADDVLIVVDDEGPGVPEEFKDAIFDVFNRGAADAAHAPGTGIGLALVSRFTELHGGRVWVEENSEGGSSFRVALPVSARPSG